MHTRDVALSWQGAGSEFGTCCKRGVPAAGARRTAKQEGLQDLPLSRAGRALNCAVPWPHVRTPPRPLSLHVCRAGQGVLPARVRDEPQRQAPVPGVAARYGGAQGVRQGPGGCVCASMRHPPLVACDKIRHASEASRSSAPPPPALHPCSADEGGAGLTAASAPVAEVPLSDARGLMIPPAAMVADMDCSAPCRLCCCRRWRC